MRRTRTADERKRRGGRASGAVMKFSKLLESRGTGRARVVIVRTLDEKDRQVL